MKLRDFLRPSRGPAPAPMELLAPSKTQAASKTLPPIVAPKVPNTQQSIPSYRQQVAPTTSVLPRRDRFLASTDLLSLRSGTTPQIIRTMVKSSPDLSAAVAAYVRVGIPEDFTVISRNMDGTINPQTTDLAQQILRRITYVPDYSLGFNPQASLQSLSESLCIELLIEGALAGELVLDKARLPTRIAPVAISTLRFYEEDTGVRPIQYIGGVETNLDIPTFIYVNVDQDLKDAYPSSYLEAAQQPVLADADFTNDLRRVLKRAVQPRLNAVINEEQVRNNASPDIRNSPDEYAAYLNALIAAIQTTVNGLSPEDALVNFDSIEYKYVEGQSNNLDSLYQAIQGIIDSKLGTAAKTMPAVLGHGSTSTAASAETMLFLKHADLFRRKLNEFYSRMLTVAVRLFGQDVYVDFRYAQLDLRPQGELEAYRSMEQSRILTLNSLGFMSDEETAVRLTGKLPPPGMTPLAGTMYAVAPTGATGNPDSQTSTMGQNDKPSAPAAPKSVTGRKAEVVPINGIQ